MLAVRFTRIRSAGVCRRVGARGLGASATGEEKPKKSAAPLTPAEELLAEVQKQIRLNRKYPSRKVIEMVHAIDSLDNIGYVFKVLNIFKERDRVSQSNIFADISNAIVDRFGDEGLSFLVRELEKSKNSRFPRDRFAVNCLCNIMQRQDNPNHFGRVFSYFDRERILPTHRQVDQAATLYQKHGEVDRLWKLFLRLENWHAQTEKRKARLERDYEAEVEARNAALAEGAAPDTVPVPVPPLHVRLPNPPRPKWHLIMLNESLLSKFLESFAGQPDGRFEKVFAFAEMQASPETVAALGDVKARHEAALAALPPADADSEEGAADADGEEGAAEADGEAAKE